MIDEKAKFDEAESILSHRPCDNCGSADEPAPLVANPFDEDVNQKIVMQHLCAKCVTKISEDI